MIKYLSHLLFVLFMTSTGVYADIIMGIVPQQSPLKLFKVWNPVAIYLQKETGEKIILKTAKSIPLFLQDLLNKEYDFAYMNPYQYIQVFRKDNYIAEVRAKKNIRGILIRRIDSNKSFTDKDTQYIFSAPNAFAATMLTKYELLEHDKVNFTLLPSPMYVGSHDSVYKNISLGIGDIGGGIERTFNASKYSNVQIIRKTPSYPSHPFAFKTDMDEKIKLKIINALLSMPQDLLNSLNMKKMKKIKHYEYRSIVELFDKLKEE